MIVDTESLEPGAILQAVEGGMVHAVKLSALLRKADTREVFGLVGRGVTSPPVGSKVSVGNGGRGRTIGRIDGLGELFPNTGKLEHLFQIVRFDEDVARDLQGTVSDAAVSKDLRRNIFSKGLLRVRKLNQSVPVRISKRTDMTAIKRTTKGFLIGNVLHPVIERREGKVTLDRAGIARGRGGRDFARMGDGGAPVLSASGALVGFVVGRDEARTLVLPAEDVMKGMAVDFVVAERRPGSLPGASIRRRRASPPTQASAAE